MKSEDQANPHTRRGFFRSLLGESVSLLQEACGTPQLPLRELAHTGDETLRRIVPQLRIHPDFRLEPQRLLVRNQTTGGFEEVCRFDALQKFILGYFDGRRSLGDIAALVENRFGLGPAPAFENVKGFFLAMVKAACCQPARWHE